MPLRSLDRASDFVHQISGDADRPPVVDLPGVHGDWMPLERSRPMLSQRVRLIEVAYPRMATWTLNERFFRRAQRVVEEAGD